MAYASRLYPRAKPRGFTLQWINLKSKVLKSPSRIQQRSATHL